MKLTGRVFKCVESVLSFEKDALYAEYVQNDCRTTVQSLTGTCMYICNKRFRLKASYKAIKTDAGVLIDLINIKTMTLDDANELAYSHLINEYLLDPVGNEFITDKYGIDLM